MAGIDRIGKFHILETLGAGAHSSILRVRRDEDSREYALKLVPIDSDEDKKYLDQIRHEFRVGQMLSHPNIVKVFCLETESDWLFRVKKAKLLLEYVPGKTLDKAPLLKMSKLLRVFERIADAMVHMHAKGVFHADLKPNNIMLGRGVNVKILDFGLARVHGDPPKERVQGTPEYMAPETGQHKLVNERTDIYNFGATMYRLTTLRLPPQAVPGEGGLGLDKKAFKAAFVRVDELNHSAPKALCLLIQRCLSYNALKRPERMSEVQAALDRLADEYAAKYGPPYGNPMTVADWISDRSKRTEVSGIRKVFDLGRSLKDPINLSIGQPHFDVPDPIKAAAKAAIDRGANGYTPTQGAAELRDRLAADVKGRFPGQDRPVLVTSGTSGGLLLAMLATVDPGDEVIVPDPYFVSYPHLVTLAGGTSVFVDTYPDFRIDPDRIAAAVTDRTKAILLCSPSNPTGAVVGPEAMRAVAELCARRGILLISDEIYRAFHHDGPARSPAEWNPDVLVIEGFGKTYGLTGWRMGYAHGPKAVVEEMTKLQQMTFVCAPTPFQHGCVAAMDFDVSGIVADYRRKRDLLAAGLRGKYEFDAAGGAFYLFPKCPWGTGTEFVTEAIRHNLLVIPGGTFSRRDTHFRVSYAASDETLQRGIEVLTELANR